MKSSTRVKTLLSCTAFIFLCAQFSISAQPDSYSRLALQAEREVYAATSTDEFNAALWRKLDFQKQAGMFADAVATLSRLRLFALDAEDYGRYSYERVLCSYLSGDFGGALSAADEAAMSVAYTATLNRIGMLEGLAAASNGDWHRAEEVLDRWAKSALSADKAAAFEAEIEQFFKHTPRMRNPEVGYYLSILPGAGQLYAAAPASAAVAAAVNLGLIAYGVYEVIGGYYWTAWFVGCGLLSNTYFVNLERGRELTVRRNRRLTADYNVRLKEIVLDAAQ